MTDSPQNISETQVKLPTLGVWHQEEKSPEHLVLKDRGLDHRNSAGTREGSEGKVAQSCPTLCDPMNRSLPVSSVHRTLQARILEWVAWSWWWTGRSGVLRFMGSQRVRHDWATELNWTEPFLPPGDLLNPEIELRSPELQAHSFLSEPPGKPKNTGVGSLFLLQWIFPTLELNQDLLHCTQILYQLSS